MIDLVWYVTDQEFQKEESCINSNDWDESPWRPKLLGEQFGFSRNYNGRLEVLGLMGDHQCGKSSEFAQGQPWPYTGPPIEYGEDDIPICCPRAHVGHMVGGAQLAQAGQLGQLLAGAQLAQAGQLGQLLAGAQLAQAGQLGQLVAGAEIGRGQPIPHVGNMVAGAQLDILPLPETVSTLTGAAGASNAVRLPDLAGGAGLDNDTLGKECSNPFIVSDQVVIDTPLFFVNDVRWYLLSVPGSTNYFFDFERDGTPGSVNLWSGGCSALVSLIGGYHFEDTNHIFFVTPPDGLLWVQFTGFGSTSYEWIIYPEGI